MCIDKKRFCSKDVVNFTNYFFISRLSFIKTMDFVGSTGAARAVRAVQSRAKYYVLRN